MARKNKVEVIVSAKDQLSKAMDGMVSGAMERFGHKAADIISDLPQMTVELVNLGAQAQAAEHRFTQFAGGTAAASEYMTAFQKATDGAASKMESMQGAAKLLQMGLVDNADEMGSVASMATKLGDQTMSAGDRLADFSALLANQSIPRLDNFGISSGKVRKRIDELLKSGEALNREEAFKMAVMEEGQKALDTLGDTSELAKVKIDKLTAAVEDAKLGFAEMAIGIVEDAAEAGGGVDKWAEKIKGLPDTINQLKIFSSAFVKTKNAVIQGTPPLEAFSRAFAEGAGVLEEYEDALYKVGPAGNQAEEAIVDATDGIVDMNDETRILEKRLNAISLAVENHQYVTEELGNQALQTEEAMMDMADGIVEMGNASKDANQYVAKSVEEIENMKLAAIDAKSAMLDMTMNWKSFFDQNKKGAEDFAADKEKIEAEHIERLNELQEKGQATSIWIDAAAEQKKLDDLKHKLDIALLQQSEFTDKTKESTRKNKEYQIAKLQEQTAAQETLLSDYYAGRLVRQGENISSELAAEQERYNAELEALNTSQAEQEEAQRESLGRMVLQSFESWAQMKQIPADKMLEMRTAIAEEYGLIDAETADVVNTMTGAWETWATDFSTDADDVMNKMGEVIGTTGEIKGKLDSLPNSWDFSVNVTGGMPSVGPGAGVGFEFAQHGYEGMVGPGYGGPKTFMAGEGVTPEWVSIIPQGGSTNMTVGSNNTYNINDGSAASLIMDRERREKRETLSRGM